MPCSDPIIWQQGVNYRSASASHTPILVAVVRAQERVIRVLPSASGPVLSQLAVGVRKIYGFLPVSFDDVHRSTSYTRRP